MKISVVIPVKNRAHLIGMTLNSIFAQTLRPYEVIVIDDHSEDNLADAISQFGDKITLLKSAGRGPGAARNIGLRHATGDAIHYFDSDDLMSNNKFYEQAKLLSESNADFIYGPYVKAKWIDGQWKRTDAILQYYPLPEKPLTYSMMEGWALTQTVLFRASFIKRVGWWREDMRSHEDMEYGFRMARLAKKFVHENKTCVIYREHVQQLTQADTVLEEKLSNQVKMFELIRSQIEKPIPLHTFLMFTGMFATTKKYIEKTIGEKCDNSLFEQIASLYSRIYKKIDIRLNKSGWPKICGAKNSEELFQQYLSLFSSAS